MSKPDEGPSQREPPAAFDDADRLRRLCELVASCSPEHEPRISIWPAGLLRDAEAVAVIAGSFNPFTVAHAGLADAAEAAGLGRVVFALSTRTVDKERLEGALLEDRLLTLELHGERQPGRGVALLNRGLYVDQARLIRSVMAPRSRLSFVVGFDKIVQIFDARYYADRNAALEQLFDLASFAVAPRGRHGPEQLADLLDRPANRRFAGAVRWLPADPALSELSSSAFRASAARGAPDWSMLAEESEAFVRATGCYLGRSKRSATSDDTGDDYAERQRWIARLCQTHPRAE